MAACAPLRPAASPARDPCATASASLPPSAASALAPAAEARADAAVPGSESPDAGAAAPAPALVVETAIEDASGEALTAFHGALDRAARHEGKARVVFYGASHVASDLYTDVIRSGLQARFGDAGTGFVLPAPPFPAYRNAGVAFGEHHGFRGVRVKADAPVPDRYGLAGVYLVTRRGKAAATHLETRARPSSTGSASRIELYYAKAPRAGTLRFGVDGALRTLRADAPRFEAAYAAVEVTDGPHRIDLLADGDAPVRIFGVSLERDASGVVLDTLGIPGSRAAYHLLWDDALYREHLARRNPDLVVLAYGTNESGDDDAPIADYERDLTRMVARTREVAPQASCLLVGPSDRPLKNDDGTFGARPRQAQVIDAQRRVAAAYGCGFFDVVAFMGGPMAMLRWTVAQPPLATQDYVHFTRQGYAELGRVLLGALLAGYHEPEAALPSPAPMAPPPAATSALSASPGSPRSP